MPVMAPTTVNDALEAASRIVAANKVAVAVASGTVVLAGLALYIRGKRYGKHRKPSTLDLAAGGIEKNKIKNEFHAYANSYGQEAGQGIIDRSKTAQLVDTFYNLVTDIYEWGWGTSFHFSPALPGRDKWACEVAHEARIPAILGLKKGSKCLDAGCGVGGPMRTIASTSGANVVGLTINDYQVQRATYHNEKLGVDQLCKAVQGNFLVVPFEENTFDGAYAIEATCHAPKLEQVYAQIFKVLKPGARFVSYEWVTTKEYDPNNPEHVRIIDEINFGNGLPEMRSYKEAEQAGVAVGFTLVDSRDLAVDSVVAGPWYGRLSFSRYQHWINHGIVSTLTFLHLVPKGVKDVHKMLVDVAHSLAEGGITGIFTPMHMLVFEKPAE